MTEVSAQPPARIESLRVQNYRVLRDLELSKLPPLTVLLGPPSSRKMCPLRTRLSIRAVARDAAPRDALQLT